MTEYEQAIALANKVLDRVNADPDDDLAVLARQFLRAVERTPPPPAWDAPYNYEYEPVETRAKQIYDGFKYEGVGKKPKWVPGGNSHKQDEARDQARKELRAAGHSPERR